MLHIAILTGGPSSERGISLKSAELVEKYLDRTRYTVRVIDMEENGWIDRDSGKLIDLNDFSITVQDEKLVFDFVFLIVHGTPAEDGKIQGYFELKGIPHSTCHTLSSALTFDKQKCKNYLKAFHVPMAPSKLVCKSKPIDPERILDLGLPLFVKPNANGSSYGVTKVMKPEELLPAIEKAFEFDQEVMVEAFLDGVEYSSGVVKHGEKYHAFPITEIRPSGEFFDYEAKYEGASDEITPAPIEKKLEIKCQDLSRRLYKILDCWGMVRFDYILVDDEFYLLEANTIPGLSEASIIPQQALAYGWSLEHLFNVVIEDCMGIKKKK